MNACFTLQNVQISSSRSRCTTHSSASAVIRFLCKRHSRSKATKIFSTKTWTSNWGGVGVSSRRVVEIIPKAVAISRNEGLEQDDIPPVTQLPVPLDTRDVTVRPAADLVELRAAAAARTAAFHTYPEGRSEYVRRTHMKMLLDSEWSALQRKMTGREPGYRETEVSPLLALVDAPEDKDDEQRLREGMDHACKLPVKGDERQQICIGSLDINYTETFVSEELMPLNLSSEGEGRAFIANVCAAPGARRRGIAKLMLEKAEAMCLEKGVHQLYVHVVPSNEAAYRLYTEHGFTLETEETADFAHWRDRERRLLLFKRLEKETSRGSLKDDEVEAEEEKEEEEIVEEVEAEPGLGSRLTIRPAADLIELRAAAAARAAAFHTYPEGRSEYVIRTHLKMQMDSEFSALQRKMTGREPGYRETEVSPLLALVDMPEDAEDETELSQGMDPACKLAAKDDVNAQVCIGSLDINFTDLFVSEELMPIQLSSEGEGRAFLANVCAAPGARRRGIARAMVEKAEEVCIQKGIQQLYVHVVPSNEAAYNLYSECGFTLETEEKAEFAYWRDRERRLLLFKRLEVSNPIKDADPVQKEVEKEVVQSEPEAVAVLVEETKYEVVEGVPEALQAEQAAKAAVVEEIEEDEVVQEVQEVQEVKEVKEVPEELRASELWRQGLRPVTPTQEKAEAIAEDSETKDKEAEVVKVPEVAYKKSAPKAVLVKATVPKGRVVKKVEEKETTEKVVVAANVPAKKPFIDYGLSI